MYCGHFINLYFIYILIFYIIFKSDMLNNIKFIMTIVSVELADTFSFLVS